MALQVLQELLNYLCIYEFLEKNYIDSHDKKFRHHRKDENNLLSNGLLAAGVMRSLYLWYVK
ncbi:hypothetical protein CV945_16625, partial [Geobacillus sp. Manikaran-105]